MTDNQIVIEEQQPTVVEIMSQHTTVEITSTQLVVNPDSDLIVEVDVETTVTTVEVEPQVIHTVEVMPQPAITVVQIGTEGPPGPSGGRFEHVQGTPSTTWDINHFLGYRPNVIVLDTLGRVVYGAVSYPSVDHMVLTFSMPIAGTAYLS